ncbi:MAG: hypothetical protein C4308_09785 [Chitinophagaceae bacterium]
MGHYHGGGGMHYSAQFIYDGNGRIIKWIDNDGVYDYFYTGNNITRRVYTENSGVVWYVDSIRYNPDNSIASIDFYDYSGTYYPDTPHNKAIFHYQVNKVSKVENLEYYAIYGGPPMIDTLVTTMTWDAAGNMVKMDFLDLYLGYADSVLYQYDNNPN